MRECLKSQVKVQWSSQTHLLGRNVCSQQSQSASFLEVVAAVLIKVPSNMLKRW